VIKYTVQGGDNMSENMYDRIKRLRIEKGWSQDELAEKVGYQGRSTISKVEHGDRDIGESLIQKFADALGVKPSYLISGENEETPAANEDNERAKIFLNLFLKLSPERQDMIINLMKEFSGS